MWHKFWFGDTECAIHIRREGVLFVATPYKSKAGDPLARKNLGVQVIERSEEEALRRAYDYLVRRYGKQGSLISISRNP